MECKHKMENKKMCIHQKICLIKGTDKQTDKMHAAVTLYT